MSHHDLAGRPAAHPGDRGTRVCSGTPAARELLTSGPLPQARLLPLSLEEPACHLGPATPAPWFLAEVACPTLQLRPTPRHRPAQGLGLFPRPKANALGWSCRGRTLLHRSCCVASAGPCGLTVRRARLPGGRCCPGQSQCLRSRVWRPASELELCAHFREAVPSRSAALVLPAFTRSVPPIPCPGSRGPPPPPSAQCPLTPRASSQPQAAGPRARRPWSRPDPAPAPVRAPQHRPGACPLPLPELIHVQFRLQRNWAAASVWLQSLCFNADPKLRAHLALKQQGSIRPPRPGEAASPGPQKAQCPGLPCDQSTVRTSEGTAVSASPRQLLSSGPAAAHSQDVLGVVASRRCSLPWPWASAGSGGKKDTSVRRPA